MHDNDNSPAHAATFKDLELCKPLLDALAHQGYDRPTPIQSQAIPHLLDGRDLLGVAQTGTGKTAAFALPILDILDDGYERPRPGRPRALVLTPTRELAAQISDSFDRYGKHLPQRAIAIFGGVSQRPQETALKRGVDTLVATPGRLIDLMDQRVVRLDDVEIFVLDEADRMLDMGFVRDVKRISRDLPERRQSLLFSATMPSEIASLAKNLLHDPIRVDVSPPSTTVERVEQHVCFVDKPNKRMLLETLLRDEDFSRVVVFTRTKHGADRLARQISKKGVAASAIHGNKSQGQRERALAGFRKGNVRVLVATDIAARGLDIREISHVINFDLPNEPESYVHRIGRTARAGRGGIAISFCDGSEREYLDAIQKDIGRKLDILEVDPRYTRSTPPRAERPPTPGQRRGPSNRNSRGRGTQQKQQQRRRRGGRSRSRYT